eukprot:COSAG05_NODE_19070_length_298_cov_0.773869_1_plen_70_part_10
MFRNRHHIQATLPRRRGAPARRSPPPAPLHDFSANTSRAAVYAIFAGHKGAVGPRNAGSSPQLVRLGPLS